LSFPRRDDKHNSDCPFTRIRINQIKFTYAYYAVNKIAYIIKIAIMLPFNGLYRLLAEALGHGTRHKHNTLSEIG